MFTLCSVQLAVLRAQRERERDVSSAKAVQGQSTADELTAVRSRLRDTEVRLEDRTAELDDLRRR